MNSSPGCLSVPRIRASRKPRRRQLNHVRDGCATDLFNGLLGKPVVPLSRVGAGLRLLSRADRGRLSDVSAES